MYTAYVRPILEYSSNVFNPYLKKDVKKLEKIQITATKLIHHRCFRGNEFSYSEILKKLNLKTLQERRLISDLILYHKIIHNKIRINSRHKPIISLQRNRVKINTMACKSYARFNSFFVRMSRIYSKLPPELIINPSQFSFKNSLSKICLSNF